MNAHDDYSALGLAVREHPAGPIAARLRAIAFSWTMHDRNATQLSAAFAAHMNPKDLIRTWAWRRRPALRAELAEMTRLLANYVASADALIDQAKAEQETHRVSHPATSSAIGRDFNEIRAKPVAAFFRALRDNIMHVGPQPVSAIFHGDRGTSRLVLHATQARSLRRMSKAARSFVEAAGDDGVDLWDACRAHDAELEAFNAQLRGHVERAHAAPLASYRSLLASLAHAEKILFPDE